MLLTDRGGASDTASGDGGTRRRVGHGPRLDPALGVDRIPCAPGAWTEVDAATWDFAATCAVGVGPPVGEYGVPGWTLFDRFGQITRVSIATTDA